MQKKNTKICTKCGLRKIIETNYAQGFDDDGYDFWCNACRKKIKNIEKLKEYCDENKRFFSVELYNEGCLYASKKEDALPKDIDNSAVKYYYSKMNLHQHKREKYKVEIEEEETEMEEKGNNSFLDSKDSFFDNISLSELQDKWGYGYTSEEYVLFEKKYNLLKNNYSEKTAMHKEALCTYIRYRVKEEIATAKGKVRDAKEWGNLASKSATDAKINPSQLSKSDLSDGLDTFGQLVRTVEQAVDIIPILPRFKEKPQDSPDFTIWCYVNYIRDLKGLDMVEYGDIYKFYEERKKEYENRLEHLKKGGK